MGKNTKRALKAAMLIAMLAVLFFILRKIGFSSIYSNLLSADKTYLLLSFLSALALFLAWNLKWKKLVDEVKPVKFWKLLPVLMAGSFVNTTTPGARVGGEPVRAYYLSKEHKIGKSRFFATTVVDKVSNSIVFAALSAASILFVVLFVKIDTSIKIILETVLAVMFLAVAAGILLRRRIKFKRKYIKKSLEGIYYFFLFNALRKKFNTYKKFEEYIIKKANSIINTTKKILTKTKLLNNSILLALTMWGFNYLGTFFLFKAFGYNANFLAVAIVVTLSILIGSIFALPGGIGLIETLMISLYLAFGINSSVAATVAVIDRFIFYFYSLFAGGICFAYLSIKHKR